MLSQDLLGFTPYLLPFKRSFIDKKGKKKKRQEMSLPNPSFKGECCRGKEKD